MQAERAVDRLGHADAAVPAHDLRVVARTEPLPAEHESSEKPVLREDILGAPEPVGIPAPEVVVDAEIVFALLGDRAVIDFLVRVVARIRRLVDESAQRNKKLALIENSAVDEVCVARLEMLFKFLKEPARVGKSEM